MNLEAAYRGGRNNCAMREGNVCRWSGKTYMCIPKDLTVREATAFVEACIAKFTGRTLGDIGTTDFDSNVKKAEN